MRLTEEQMQELMDRENVTRTWSWSRLGCFHNSMYEYYLHYIKHEKEDRADSIYVVTGGLAHDILEKFYNNEIKYDDMLDLFYDGWITAYDMAELKFDMTDEEKNKKLADKYCSNLIHFFKNHDVMNNPLMEQFVKIKVGNNLLIGYIDAVTKDDNGCINVIDFKTSSIYKGKNLLDKSGQLCLYCLGLMQQGVPLEKLKASFNFLKYCNIEYQQANGTVKERTVERIKIGESLQSNLKMWLKKLDYQEEDIAIICDALLKSNDINVLPDNVKCKYKVKDCYVYVPLSQELLDKWQDYIITTIKDIELREADYEKTQSDKCFWDNEEDVKAQSFYFANLCAYSRNKHKPYNEYLEKLEQLEKEKNNLFSNVGSDSLEVKTSSKVDDDLSWLNELM